MKKLVLSLTLLTSTCLIALPTLATPLSTNPPIACSDNEDLMSIHQINFNVPITLAEFVTVIVQSTGTQLSPVMDTHYAMDAMTKADEMGLLNLDDYPIETWSEEVCFNHKSAILSNAMHIQGTDIGSIYSALNKVLLDSIVINEKTVDLNRLPLQHSNGQVLLPIRPVAEAMGFDVEWDPELYTVTLNNGKIQTVIQVGFDSYCYTSVKAIGMSAPFSVGASPQLIDGICYVPAKALEMFGVIDTVGSTLHITQPDTNQLHYTMLNNEM